MGPKNGSNGSSKPNNRLSQILSVKLNLNSFIQKSAFLMPNPWVTRGRLPIFMEPAQRLERGVQERARREPANIRITITNLC